MRHSTITHGLQMKVPEVNRGGASVPRALVLGSICTGLAFLAAGLPNSASADPPNVVIIFIDDLGYADIGPFGEDSFSTPNLDRMAAEGMKLTDFHAATAVCSASRAALLTGCYPKRVGILGALGPDAKIGLNPSETTIAELCKSLGYATAIFGKWHLGCQTEFLPLQHGFDEWYGLPYSNDMWPFHPDFADLPPAVAGRKRGYPPLPMYEGNSIVNAALTADDQAQLTTQYTERAVDFISRNRNRPFFLYLPHSMVHVPLFVSEKFKGRSGAGLFGDVVMEVDWSVGRVLAALKQTGVDENTLVIFTSDNGPWLSYGDHAGSAGPLREGKGTMFEGGCRVPCIVRWPGHVPAGTVCSELATTMDLFPTIARLIGGELPPDRIIDGKDIWPLLAGEPGAVTPHEAFYCYFGGELRAIRDRRYKLHLPHTYRTLAGRPGGTGGTPVPYSQATIGLELFDVQNDPGETTDVAEQYPQVVQRLIAHVEAARHALGDRLTDTRGENTRPPGRAR